MLTYRTFRNTDPPLLTSIWRSRAEQAGLAAPISVDVLEQYVFAKLYFDYHGLVLAFEDNEAVGFAHAGFGPSEDERLVSTELGTTCLILARPDCRTGDVAAGLLEQSEAYLRDRGAKVLYGGGIRPLNAFYFGLYGGSEMPGVLARRTDWRRRRTCRGATRRSTGRCRSSWTWRRSRRRSIGSRCKSAGRWWCRCLPIRRRGPGGRRACWASSM